MWRYDTDILLNDEVVAKLTFDTWSMMKATLETSTGKWALEMGGGFTNEYAVFDLATGDEIAILEGGLTGNARLTLRNREDLNLAFKNTMSWTKTEYFWIDEKEHELIFFNVSMQWTGYNIVIEVNNALTKDIDTLFLIGLGVYMLTHRQIHSSAV